MTAHFHVSLAIHLDDSASQSCFVSTSSELILTVSESRLVSIQGSKVMPSTLQSTVRVNYSQPGSKFGCGVLRGITSDALVSNSNR